MDSEIGGGIGKHQSVKEDEDDMIHFDESFPRLNSWELDQCFEGVGENSETNTSGSVTHCQKENSKSSLSVPSFSSDFSSDDYFQVYPIIYPSSKPTNHNAATPKSEENTEPEAVDWKNDVYSSTEPLYQLEEIFGSSCSVSPVSNLTNEPLVPTSPPTQSPTIQVMERSTSDFDPDPDPNHIPASVFARSSTPMDWSMASNDSLFSIPIGNLSFSRDHIGKLDGYTGKHKEIGRSRDLDYSNEFYRSGELKSSSDIVRLRQPSPVIKGEDHELWNLDFGKTGVLGKEKEKLNRTIKDQEINPDEANAHTDESKTNGQSLAFPKKKFSWSSCFCTNLCSCKWACCSSCFCKNPDSCCCSCKRPCCSCKCLSQPCSSCMPSCCCCCKWPSCSGSCCNSSSGCCKSLSCQSCQCKSTT